jgi:transposase-like protein
MSGIHGPSGDRYSIADRWRRSQLETIRDRAEEKSDLEKPGGLTTPARCPSCRSLDVVTTSKVVTVDAYWRCCGCGEVWNVGRLRTAAKSQRDGSFRR